MKWYDDYKHIGYNWEGKKILKPEKGDQLDNFLKRMEDPDFWRTIKDPQTGQDVVLSEADIQLITRIQKQKVPDTQFDEYAVRKFQTNFALEIQFLSNLLIFFPFDFYFLAMGRVVYVRSDENTIEKIPRAQEIICAIKN